MLAPLFSKIGRYLPSRLWPRKLRPIAQDGNRPNDGPPDLDQLWRDFNKRLNGWFGQGKGGGGNEPQPSSPDFKGAGIGAGVILSLLAFFWLASGVFIVQEGHTAVVLTFGKYSQSDNRSAGFNWRWPYPIQAHEIVNDSQVRTVEVGFRRNVKNKEPHEALMLTDDENIIEVQFAVQYKIKAPADWVFNNRRDFEDSRGDQDDTMLRQVAETAIREIVGKSEADFVLYQGREKVAADVNQLMQSILTLYKSGVQITNVTMQNVQPPEQVQGAFDDVQKAGQDKARKINDGQAYARDVIPKAQGDASRILQEAEAYRSRVSETATGDASRFKQVVAEYQKAPAVTRDRMYLETMQQVYANATKVLVDAKGGNNLISLPIDKMLQSAANEQAAAKAAAPAQVVVTPSTAQAEEAARARDGRTRDARDRESR